MQNGMYINAAGALAAQTRMEVLANNLANVETPGFRRGFAVFQERLSEAWEPPVLEPGFDHVLDAQGGGLFVHEVTFTSEVGPITQTGQDLDLAISGPGWFSVERDGETLYTRAGNFNRGADGSLLTASGAAQLLDRAGEPVVVPASGRLTVDEGGRLSVDGERLTEIVARGPVDYRLFTPVGDNLYRYEEEGIPEATASPFRQGFLERSTVSPVIEMVNLIRTFRSYESNQRVITQQDQALGRAVNDVGRVA